ncbi:MAG: TonB-dependent receptor [Prevotellaceae bacterium]|nr:TonB-dependent receptor [Prevotellaceae bacterium]
MLFLGMLMCHYAQGQITIQGTITDKSGAALSGISVLLTPPNQNTILVYSLSDASGHYWLNYTGTADSLQLTVNGFDYEKIVRIIVPMTQTIDFTLKEQPIVLSEVVVKATPISQKGDTLNYLVSAFAGKGDRVIGDVLKKMPGIEVSAGGRIKYNGKEINKFYVENLDLLQGRYAIATNNISAKDVASVEVYEYHQPIKALAGVSPSDQAAINLKLQDGAKGALSAMGQLGIGVAPLLWNNELTSLYFAKKRQNINTYKGNNSGNDVAQELTSFYSHGGNYLDNGQFLSVLSPAPPPINTQRYLFNNIHSGSINVLQILPREYELTANISYYNDYQVEDSYSRSSYYFSTDSTFQMEELLHAGKTLNNLDAAVNITANKDNFYLTDKLNVKAAWDGEAGVADTVGQRLQSDSYQIYNNFELIKTLPNDRSIRFYSFNGYAHTPQQLAIQPGLYADLLNHGQPFVTLEQNTLFRHFSSKTSFNFSTAKRGFRQNYYGGIDVDIQQFHSLLQPLQQTGVPASVAPDSLQNELHWQIYKAYITGNYIYERKYFRIEVSLPVSYRLLLIEDVFPQQKQTINRFLCNPDIAITYDLSRYWRLKAGYSFTQNMGALQDSYTGYLMQNYRNFNKNDGRLADYKTHSYVFRIIYRNALKALFANIDFFYEQHHSNMLRERSFSGLLQVQNTLNQSVVSQMYGVNGSISKNLYNLHSTVSLSANYYESASSQMVQGALLDFRYRNYGFKPGIESQPVSWGGISYALLWSKSRSIVAGNTVAYPLLRSVSNRITVNLFPVAGLTLSMGYEHYYNNAVAEGKNCSFADVSASYKFKSVELAFICSNVFNAKQYVTASYDNVSAFLSVYDIRPAQVLVTAKFKLW